ncbi:MAG TPA: Ig-like domain-containing protein, partial [Blastocatellia bacterium]|nr:Ig-like domain-containing protein [Blastocatellia bacterium]
TLLIQIQAQVGNEIVVVVRQPDGVEYSVSQGAYSRPDGFTTVGVNGGVVASADGALSLSIPRNAVSGQADFKLTGKTEADITVPRLNEMSSENMVFAGGVQIEAQGTFTTTQELHLELPAPAGAQEGRRVAFLKPSRVREGGQDVDVWETVTSGRVEGGKLKTSSPPFFGLLFLDWNIVLFTFFPVRQRVVIGEVTAPIAQGSTERSPVANALCILGDNTLGGIANHLVTRTTKEGIYAIFDVHTQEPTGSFVHAIDDTNGRRGVGAPRVTETVESRFLQGLQGFAVYKADIVLPATGGGGGTSGPPQLTVTGRSTNGPVEEDPLVQFGVVRLPATVGIAARTDRPIQQIVGNLLIGSVPGPALTWTLAENQGQIQTYLSTLDVTAEGSYSIVVRGFTVSGDASTATRVTYNFVALRNPNLRTPQSGPPRVLVASPARNAVDVDVTTDVRIEFSEPVVNLVGGQTVYLQEEGKTEKIGGQIISGGILVQPDTPGISTITFRPSRNLDASKRYCLNITTGVVDIPSADTNTTPLALDQDSTGNGSPYIGCFTTFGGFVLTDTPVSEQGFRIVITGSYAITLAQNPPGVGSKISIYDISDPTSPGTVGSLTLPQRATDLAVSEEVTYKGSGRVFTRIVTVLTSNAISPEQPANLWVINLDEPERPELVGVTSLYVPLQLATTPLSVCIHGDRAFVGSSPYRGVIAVDLAKSIELFAAQVDRQRPVFDAATPAKGFGWEARVQSVRYYSDAARPSVATSVAALGDLVFAADTGGKQL